MTTQTDPEFDALMDKILETQREYLTNRTPRQAARDKAQSEWLQARDGLSLRERALDAARRLNKDEARALFDRQLRLSVKDELDDDELDELGEIHRQVRDHPCALPFDVLIEVGDVSEIPWLVEYRQESTWNWLWWADHLGYSLDEYLARGNGTILTPEAIEVIRQSQPYPEGWKPETRR